MGCIDHANGLDLFRLSGTLTQVDTELIFWLCVWAGINALAVYLLVMTRRYRMYFLVTLFCLLVPITLVSMDCMENPSSEACVWGQSFMPLYLAVAAFGSAPVLFLGGTAIAWAYKRIRGRVDRA